MTTSLLVEKSCLMAGKMVHVVFSGKKIRGGIQRSCCEWHILPISWPRTQKCFSMRWGACKKSCATEDKYLMKQDDAFVSAWGQIYSSFHCLLPPKSLKLELCNFLSSAITWSSRFPSKAKLVSLPCTRLLETESAHWCSLTFTEITLICLNGCLLSPSWIQFAFSLMLTVKPNYQSYCI